MVHNVKRLALVALLLALFLSAQPTCARLYYSSYSEQGLAFALLGVDGDDGEPAPSQCVAGATFAGNCPIMGNLVSRPYRLATLASPLTRSTPRVYWCDRWRAIYGVSAARSAGVVDGGPAGVDFVVVRGVAAEVHADDSGPVMREEFCSSLSVVQHGATVFMYASYGSSIERIELDTDTGVPPPSARWARVLDMPSQVLSVLVDGDSELAYVALANERFAFDGSGPRKIYGVPNWAQAKDPLPSRIVRVAVPVNGTNAAPQLVTLVDTVGMNPAYGSQLAFLPGRQRLAWVDQGTGVNSLQLPVKCLNASYCAQNTTLDVAFPGLVSLAYNASNQHVALIEASQGYTRILRANLFNNTIRAFTNYEQKVYLSVAIPTGSPSPVLYPAIYYSSYSKRSISSIEDVNADLQHIEVHIEAGVPTQQYTPRMIAVDGSTSAFAFQVGSVNALMVPANVSAYSFDSSASTVYPGRQNQFGPSIGFDTKLARLVVMDGVGIKSAATWDSWTVDGWREDAAQAGRGSSEGIIMSGPHNAEEVWVSPFTRYWTKGYVAIGKYDLAKDPAVDPLDPARTAKMQFKTTDTYNDKIFRDGAFARGNTLVVGDDQAGNVANRCGPAPTLTKYFSNGTGAVDLFSSITAYDCGSFQGVDTDADGNRVFFQVRASYQRNTGGYNKFVQVFNSTMQPGTSHLIWQESGTARYTSLAYRPKSDRVAFLKVATGQLVSVRPDGLGPVRSMSVNPFTYPRSLVYDATRGGVVFTDRYATRTGFLATKDYSADPKYGIETPYSVLYTPQSHADYIESALSSATFYSVAESAMYWVTATNNLYRSSSAGTPEFLCSVSKYVGSYRRAVGVSVYDGVAYFGTCRTYSPYECVLDIFPTNNCSVPIGQHSPSLSVIYGWAFNNEVHPDALFLLGENDVVRYSTAPGSKGTSIFRTLGGFFPGGAAYLNRTGELFVAYDESDETGVYIVPTTNSSREVVKVPLDFGVAVSLAVDEDVESGTVTVLFGAALSQYSDAVPGIYSATLKRVGSAFTVQSRAPALTAPALAEVRFDGTTTYVTAQPVSPYSRDETFTPVPSLVIACDGDVDDPATALARTVVADVPEYVDMRGNFAVVDKMLYAGSQDLWQVKLDKSNEANLFSQSPLAHRGAKIEYAADTGRMAWITSGADVSTYVQGGAWLVSTNASDPLNASSPTSGTVSSYLGPYKPSDFVDFAVGRDSTYYFILKNHSIVSAKQPAKPSADPRVTFDMVVDGTIPFANSLAVNLTTNMLYVSSFNSKVTDRSAPALNKTTVGGLYLLDLSKPGAQPERTEHTLLMPAMIRLAANWSSTIKPGGDTVPYIDLQPSHDPNHHKKNKDHYWTSGRVAGVFAAVCAGVGVIIAIVFYCRRRRRHRAGDASEKLLFSNAEVSSTFNNYGAHA